MFLKVLIANRGEIAVRVARTCRALGIRVAVVYSDADRTALHVRVADEAYRIGPGPARESYLNVEAILKAAAQSGAEAIHPGYGFLSENAEFAERVAAAGLTFIGPPAEAIRLMGDKAAAKRLLAEAGVSVVPGYQGEDQSAERLLAEAETIGYPLLIKAVAGGGGRGMRAVASAEEFPAQLESARREALSAFGDERVLLERLVQHARHVEVQVFADTHGNVVQLGERDCSVQRRHQKVFEEAPSPAVDAELRRRMGEAAVRAAQRAGYVNAGTVEFLLEPSGAFYFLEMNTRLQVEHPVTEFVTGLDLVQLQLEVAAGQPLPFTQDDIQLGGHAIEARLYAEDPFNSYLPAAGKLTGLALPSGEGVRVDTGFTAGDAVSPYYDTMLAKLIAHGADRGEALSRLIAAFDTTHVEGLATNLPLLRLVAEAPQFAAGAATIDFLDRFWSDAAPESVPEEVLLTAAGYLLTTVVDGRTVVDPWSGLGPWRIGGAPRTLHLAAEGRHYSAVARPGAGPGCWLLTIDAADHDVHFERVTAGEILLRRGAAVTVLSVVAAPSGSLSLGLNGRTYGVTPVALAPPDSAAAGAYDGAASGKLTAPMPGLVVKLNVAVGDHVCARQTLVVLEAMKIEHAIRAPSDGVVAHVHCEAGSRVAAGAVLIELEPAE